jgi:hypothetical protein
VKHRLKTRSSAIAQQVSALYAANRRIRKAELRRKRLPRYQSLAEDNVGLQIDNHAAIAR